MQGLALPITGTGNSFSKMNLYCPSSRKQTYKARSSLLNFIVMNVSLTRILPWNLLSHYLWAGGGRKTECRSCLVTLNQNRAFCWLTQVFESIELSLCLDPKDNFAIRIFAMWTGHCHIFCLNISFWCTGKSNDAPLLAPRHLSYTP